MGLKYASSPDLVYPGTTVLINLVGIRDQAELLRLETECVMAREESLPEWQPGADYFRSIHRHLFQDVYAWAGQYRVVPLKLTPKDGPVSVFCQPQFIPANMDRILGEVTAERLLGCTGRKFSSLFGHVVTELNAVHPFREGNGRVMRAYVDMAARVIGRSVDWSKVLIPEWHAASVNGFHLQDSGPMTRLLSRALHKIRSRSRSSSIEM